MGRPLKRTGIRAAEMVQEADLCLAQIKQKTSKFMSKYSADPADYHAFMWALLQDLEQLHLTIHDLDDVMKAAAVARRHKEE